jgi:putative ABC transport system ATP-binding protein
MPRESVKPPLLATRDLQRTVKERPLVDGISIEVQRGEVLAVIGPSGSGKTSFLRLLNRLDEPTGGSVWLEGVDYREIAPRELRRRVGMVMQTASLFPGTVADNIRYGPRQHGRELSDAYVAEMLEEVDLGGFAGRRAENLSGGEAQRVALARVIANEPDVLLLDEPTSALDAAARDQVKRLLLRVVQRTGLTCIVVTHDTTLAARMADRVMVVRGGRVERIGPKEQVLDVEGIV